MLLFIVTPCLIVVVQPCKEWIPVEKRNFLASSPLKQNSILKFQDKILFGNILLAIKSLNDLLPSVSHAWFSFFLDQHNYETLNSAHSNLIKLLYKTIWCRSLSITSSTVELRDKIQNNQKRCYSKIYPPIKLKQLPVILS